jgi:hypothetical protein
MPCQRSVEDDTTNDERACEMSFLRGFHPSYGRLADGWTSAWTISFASPGWHQAIHAASCRPSTDGIRTAGRTSSDRAGCAPRPRELEDSHQHRPYGTPARAATRPGGTDRAGAPGRVQKNGLIRGDPRLVHPRRSSPAPATRPERDLPPQMSGELRPIACLTRGLRHLIWAHLEPHIAVCNT